VQDILQIRCFLFFSTQILSSGTNSGCGVDASAKIHNSSGKLKAGSPGRPEGSIKL
jgi:hypothetical protein